MASSHLAPLVVDDVDVRDLVQRDRHLALALPVVQRVRWHLANGRSNLQLGRPPRMRPQRLLGAHGPLQELRL